MLQDVYVCMLLSAFFLFCHSGRAAVGFFVVFDWVLVFLDAADRCFMVIIVV